jgi:hypothetical protein
MYTVGCRNFECSQRRNRKRRFCPLSQLVQGGFQKTSKYVDKALAATPAGNRLYASEPYELIIKSETGRYITPASEHLFSKLSF